MWADPEDDPHPPLRPGDCAVIDTWHEDFVWDSDGPDRAPAIYPSAEAVYEWAARWDSDAPFGVDLNRWLVVPYPKFWAMVAQTSQPSYRVVQRWHDALHQFDHGSTQPSGDSWSRIAPCYSETREEAEAETRRRIEGWADYGVWNDRPLTEGTRPDGVPLGGLPQVLDMWVERYQYDGRRATLQVTGTTAIVVFTQFGAEAWVTLQLMAAPRARVYTPTVRVAVFPTGFLEPRIASAVAHFLDEIAQAATSLESMLSGARQVLVPSD
jgi:hypothetical protein